MGWREDYTVGTKNFPRWLFSIVRVLTPWGASSASIKAEGNFESLVHHGCERND